MHWWCAPAQKGYTDQQMIAGRAIQASYSWLNRERDEIGTHKERRLARSGPTLTAAITPVVFAELDLKQQAELLPLTYVAQFTPLFVRPEHPTTAKAMTFKGEETNRLPLCSDLLHQWAMRLVTGNPTALTKMDPLSSPDLLFPMPTRSSPLYYVTPNDVKLLMRPNTLEAHVSDVLSKKGLQQCPSKPPSFHQAMCWSSLKRSLQLVFEKVISMGPRVSFIE